MLLNFYCSAVSKSATRPYGCGSLVLPPLVSENLRAKRRGIAGRSWYLDETYIKVSGRWRYLYRAIDREGHMHDSMLIEHRDKHAARRFLRRLIDSAERKPLRVTRDGSVRTQCSTLF